MKAAKAPSLPLYLLNLLFSSAISHPDQKETLSVTALRNGASLSGASTFNSHWGRFSQIQTSLFIYRILIQSERGIFKGSDRV
jgi:hypothetical protein